MKMWIEDRYGTLRGLVRPLLAQLERRVGTLRSLMLQHPEHVKRVVFVCMNED